ncbi:MAG: hypothetical protein KDA51_01170 [Planctomycetales bacterium]|nr:hypothetical protein [Planctomycetales bacterium]
MARPNRSEVISPDESCIVHVISRVVRRCFLLGDDPLTGKNYDHRKEWIEILLQHQAKHFGVDLLCFSLMSSHFHLVLKSQPEIVGTWTSREVARRWLMLCPKRKLRDGSPAEPKETEINSIAGDAVKLKQIRSRLSDISWWMRLLCQKIAVRANKEDEATGKFFEGRFRSIRILDESGLLACAAYVDLNPIRAALAETLEESDYTSAQRRSESLQSPDKHSDRFLAPITIDELRDGLGARPSSSGYRCSDNGFLNMSSEDYLALLDWTARQPVNGKPGITPADTPAILQRLGLEADVWCELVRDIGSLFSLVAGRPAAMDAARTLGRQARFHTRPRTRELLSV